MNGGGGRGAGETGPPGSFASSIEEEVQESSCWIESKSDHIDDNKSDATHSSNLQDGKFSLLQFALFNFKEAVDMYELVCSKDGSLKDATSLMESLKGKKKKKKSGGDGADWTWKELSDLVKYSPVSTPFTSSAHSHLSPVSGAKCLPGFFVTRSDSCNCSLSLSLFHSSSHLFLKSLSHSDTDYVVPVEIKLERTE